MRPDAARAPRIAPAEARRIAVAAQGLLRPRPGRSTLAHLDRLLGDVGVVQIDSVNVLARSHRLVLFARLGAHDEALVERATARAPRRMLESWAHEASFVAPATHRLLRYRRTRDHEAWGMIARAADDPALVARVRDAVAAHGPVTGRALEAALAHDGPRRGNGYAWAWSEVKRTLELLFWRGEVSSAGRTRQFERRYDLAERVVPPAVHAAPDPTEAEALVGLVRLAARAQGIATTASLRDHVRLAPADADPAIAALAEAGEIVPVRVGAAADGDGRAATSRVAGGTGWWLHTGARRPRSASTRALLSPFDSLIWHRPRTRSLFGFDYRLEIYVPAARRRHGYYVLPFLLGDRLVARVDLKADRAAGRLRVLGAHAEPGAPARTAEALAGELGAMAAWLGLGAVAVEDRGDLARALRSAVR